MMQENEENFKSRKIKNYVKSKSNFMIQDEEVEEENFDEKSLFFMNFQDDFEEKSNDDDDRDFMIQPKKFSILPKVHQLQKKTLRSQSFTSWLADLRQDINRVSSISRCLNGTFPWRNCSIMTLAHKPK